jgi:hypothetical protein
MKIKLSLILWFLCLTLLETGCLAQKEQVVVDKQEVSDLYSWDFGQAKEGEVLKHDFRLKNESKENLNIKDVDTSCSCTVSKVAKKTLMPDEETLIEIQFDTKGYSGSVQQYIYVHTDGLANPIIKFTIKANVIKNK